MDVHLHIFLSSRQWFSETWLAALQQKLSQVQLCWGGQLTASVHHPTDPFQIKSCGVFFTHGAQVSLNTSWIGGSKSVKYIRHPLATPSPLAILLYIKNTNFRICIECWHLMCTLFCRIIQYGCSSLWNWTEQKSLNMSLPSIWIFSMFASIVRKIYNWNDEPF